MKAAKLNPDGTVSLSEMDPPVAGSEEEAVVEVRAAGINPIDLATAAASAGAGAGREGVGVLDGRRFYFGATVAPYGSFATETLVPRERLYELPDEVDDGTAIALGIAGQAAWLGLEWRARLRRGEHVLVLGTGGTVGMLGIQMARLLGAGRVIAAARSEAGLERARELGADAVVALADRPRDELAAALSEAAAGRLDVVLDPLWGEPALAAMQAVTAGARVVQIGSSSSREAVFNPATLRGRLVELLPFSTAGVPADVRREGYEKSLRFAADGELETAIRELPLADAAEAWELQRSGPGAKLVLKTR